MACISLIYENIAAGTEGARQVPFDSAQGACHHSSALSGVEGQFRCAIKKPVTLHVTGFSHGGKLPARVSAALDFLLGFGLHFHLGVNLQLGLLAGHGDRVAVNRCYFAGFGLCGKGNCGGGNKSGGHNCCKRLLHDISPVKNFFSAGQMLS
jgi:hypothetical protein